MANEIVEKEKERNKNLIKGLCLPAKARLGAINSILEEVASGNANLAKLLSIEIAQLGGMGITDEIFVQMGKLEKFSNGGERLIVGLLLSNIRYVSFKNGMDAEDIAVSALVGMANNMANSNPQAAQEAARGLRARGHLLAADGIFVTIGNGRPPIKPKLGEVALNFAARVMQSGAVPSRAAH